MEERTTKLTPEESLKLVESGYLSQASADSMMAPLSPVAPGPAEYSPLMDPSNFAQAIPAAPIVPPVSADSMMAPAVQMAPPMSGMDMQTLAITQAGVAAQNQAKADQDAINAVMSEQNKIQAKGQSDADAALARAQNVETKHQAALAKLAETNISPDNYWAEKSTGQKIGIGIALIMGAFGAANGGGNKAAEVIEKAIDRDVETQKSNYLARKGEAAELGSTFGKMMDVYKDTKDATAATKAALLGQGQLQIQANAARYKGEAATANATSALGQLQASRDSELAKLAQAKALGEDPKYAGMDDKTRERYIPQSDVKYMPFGVASLGSKEDVSKFRTESVEMADAVAGLKELTAMIDMNTLKKFSPAQVSAADAKQLILTGKLRQALLGPGIMDERERAIIKSLIANPTDLLSLDSKNAASLGALTTSLIGSINRKGVSLGLKNAAPEAFLKSLGAEKGK